MTEKDFRKIGARLKTAFRLSTRPLAVYGSEVLPSGIPPMTDVNRCFAVSLYRMAAGTEISAIYVSADTSEGCCPGGLVITVCVSTAVGSGSYPAVKSISSAFATYRSGQPSPS